MKLQDFQNSKCSYPAHIPFSVTWSEDDSVALATDSGVYITDLRPNVKSKNPTLGMQRYFVPTNTYIPTRNVGINLEEVMAGLDQSGMYALIEDITVSPVLSSRQAPTPAIKYVAWSPLVSRHKLRSLLTVITDSGSLDIYYYYRDSWVKGISIAELWLRHCSSTWDKKVPSGALMEELKKRSYKVKFSAFTWGVIMENPWYDLFVSSFDGTLSFWRVQQNVETKKIIVELKNDLLIKQQLITALYCQYVPPRKYILFISYFDGTVGSVVVEYCKETTKIFKEKIIWDEMDKIAVQPGGLFSRMCFNSSSQLIAVLLILKGRHIIVANVNLSGELILYHVLNTGELFLTGLASLSQTECIITGYSGAIYRLTLEDPKPTLFKLQDSLRTIHYSCGGLALSKNKAIAVMPYSVKTNYDHLAMKDLCLLLWCSLDDINNLNKKVKSHHDSVYEIWDILEIMRIESILKGSPILWNKTSEDLDAMEINDLKMNLAILQLSIAIHNNENESSRNDDKLTFEEEIMDLILSRYIFKELSNLMEEPNLSDFKKKSFFYMKQWIDFIINKYISKYRLTLASATTIKNQLEEKSMDFNQEVCAICGKEVQYLTSQHLTTCVENHTLPRCSLSLVQCGDVPYYTCSKCNVVAHFNAVSDNNFNCVYCDGVLTLLDITLSDHEMTTIASS